MAAANKKTINLALQGGGSHGAFTWGVLDRLLEAEKDLVIEGISGTSAGAMNAAILAGGYAKGGAEGARKALDAFWTRLGDMGRFGMPQRTLVDQMLGNWNIDSSPGTMMVDVMQRMFSPYQMNPFNYNPLRQLVDELVDIDAIRACEQIKLFISATNVETGRVRIFERNDISADALMASACLPFTFQAVMIDGVPYWDGGYVGNPAVFPLIYECDSPDVLIVQVNPLIRKGTPSTPTEIVNRLNEISFNSAFIGEMRAIAFVQKLVDEDHLKSAESGRLKRMNMHLVSAEDKMLALGASSKMNTEPDFLLFLKNVGRDATDVWIRENWDKVGETSSVDLKTTFL